jgi:hypothetical protein
VDFVFRKQVSVKSPPRVQTLLMGYARSLIMQLNYMICGFVFKRVAAGCRADISVLTSTGTRN